MLSGGVFMFKGGLAPSRSHSKRKQSHRASDSEPPSPDTILSHSGPFLAPFSFCNSVSYKSKTIFINSTTFSEMFSTILDLHNPCPKSQPNNHGAH